MTRLLQTNDEYDIDLPFREGLTALAMVSVDDDETLVVFEAAMSLGLTLLATAGAALTLI
jgi:hypothetical protein